MMHGLTYPVFPKVGLKTHAEFQCGTLFVPPTVLTLMNDSSLHEMQHLMSHLPIVVLDKNQDPL